MNCPNDQLSAKHYRFNKMEKEGVIYWLKPEEGGLKNLPTYELCYAVTVLRKWSLQHGALKCLFLSLINM